MRFLDNLPTQWSEKKMFSSFFLYQVLTASEPTEWKRKAL